MDYKFRVTTHGTSLLCACMDLGAGLKITHVEAGNGLVPEDTKLEDVHQLVHPVTTAAIADRKHADNILYFSIFYDPRQHPEIHDVFTFSEFLVWAEDPESGEETDLIYGTLGDSRQRIPPWNEDAVGGGYSLTLPIQIVLSNQVNVQIAAAPGLITYDDLIRLLDAGGAGVWTVSVVIPTTGWVLEDGDGYACYVDIPVDGVTKNMIPNTTVSPKDMTEAGVCGLASFADARTGKIRFYSMVPPTTEIHADVALLGISPYISAQMVLRDFTAGETEVRELLQNVFGPAETDETQ